MADYNVPNRIEKRVRYFDGQFLKDQDFIDEQKYHINRQRLQNRLHVSGIIEGLDIQYQEKKVIVNPGTAIDQKGRLIVLANSKEIKIENITDFGTLVIFYQEKESDIATTREENNEKEKQGSAGNTRWYEDPEVTVVRKPTEEQVRLGKVIFNKNNDVEISSSNRQYSGVFLPAGDSKGVTLRAGGEQNPNLAILDGSLSITENLTISGNLEIQGDSKLTGSVNIFGVWQPKKEEEDNKQKVEEKAETDGFVVANITVEAQGHWVILSLKINDQIRVKTDVNYYYVTSQKMRYGSLTCPVKKGDKWLVEIEEKVRVDDGKDKVKEEKEKVTQEIKGGMKWSCYWISLGK